MEYIKALGIDLAKNVFQLCGVNRQGKRIYNKRVTRAKLMETLVNLPKDCRIFMEACASAHHWARKFIALGYDVQLIAPQFVKPFVRGNKNDPNDAAGIVLAGLQPNMRFVPIKTLSQLDGQSLHRARELAKKNRTAYANQIRGLLGEYGVILPQGINYVRQKIAAILEDAENGLTTQLREVIEAVHKLFTQVDDQVKCCEKKIEMLARSSEDSQRLMKLPGVGSLTATA